MKKWKGVYYSSAFAALFCTAIALYLDLLDCGNSTVSNSENWRFIRTVFCAMAVIPAIRFSVSNVSKWLLPMALALAVIADYFLILANNLKLGIGIFAIMQIVLTTRHLIGIYPSALLQIRIGLAVLISLVVIVVGNALLWPSLQPKGLAVPVLIYSSLLIISVVAAYSAGFTETLTKRQAKFAFYGMILFVLCDITVGVGAAFGDTSIGQLVRALTGLFYTPSLLMLAWSGTPHPTK